MFYALATNKVRVLGLKFSHTLTDIETLNRKAMDGEGFYDVFANKEAAFLGLLVQIDGELLQRGFGLLLAFLLLGL